MADSWKSPNYSAALLHRLRLLYEKGQLCDSTLRVGDVQVKVHSSVLCSASRYFHDRLQKQTHQGYINDADFCMANIAGCDLPNLENLVQFMYSGSLILTKTNITMTLILASRLDIPEAVALCDQYLQANPTKTEPIEHHDLDMVVEHEYTIDTQGAVKSTSKDLLNASVGLSSDASDRSNMMLHVNMKSETLGEGDDDNGIDDDVLQTIQDVEDIIKHDKPISTRVPRKRGRPRKRKVKGRPAAKTTRITRSSFGAQNEKAEVIVLGELQEVTDTKSGAMPEHEGIVSHALHDKDNNKDDDDDDDDVGDLEPFVDDSRGSTTNNDHEHESVSSRTAKRTKKQKLEKDKDEDFLPEMASDEEEDDYRPPSEKKRSSSRKSAGRNIYRGAQRKFTIIDKLQEEVLKLRKSLLNVRSDDSLHEEPAVLNESSGGGELQSVDKEEPHIPDIRSDDLQHEEPPVLDASSGGSELPPADEEEPRVPDVKLGDDELKVHDKEASANLDMPDLTENGSSTHQEGEQMTIAKEQCSEQVSDEYLCNFCDERFSSATEFSIHVKTHTAENPLTCLACGKSANNYGTLRRHLMRHLNIKPHKCEICQKRFDMRCHLNSHIMIHTGEKPHKCSFCEKAFADPSGYRKHMLSHSGERKHVCEVCSKTFLTQYSLKAHIITHSEERPYPCTKCHKKFKQSTKLKRHMETHSHTIHQCPKCRQKLKSYKSLQRHLLTHDVKRIRPTYSHICEVCGSTYNQAGSLKEHMKVHSGVKNYACTFCDKRFYKSNNLTRHLMTHTGIKPVTCEICKKGFRTNHNLQNHMRTHTGEKPYVCVECGRQFSYKKSMIRHMYQHNGIRPLTCETCGKGFIQSVSLINHKCIM